VGRVPDPWDTYSSRDQGDRRAPDRAIGTSEIGATVALGTALGDEIATGTTGFIRVGHIRLLANQRDKPSPHTLPILW
jgi:hypothetical protein